MLLNVDTVADTAGSCVGTFGKAGDFVLVVGNVEVAVPSEVLGNHGTGVDVEFKTGVLEVAEVDVTHVGEVRARRIVCPHEEVGGLTLIVLDATVDTVVEEREVKTEVPSGGFFPLEVGVVLFGVHDLYVVAVDGVCVALADESVVDRQVGEVVAAEVLLACHTVVDTELEVVEDAAGAFHKAFVKNLPAESHSGEGTPAMVLAETARTVATHGGGEQVAVHEGVVDTAEERHELVAGAVERCRAVLVACIVFEGNGFAVVEVGVGEGDVGLRNQRIGYRKVVALVVEALPGVTRCHVEVAVDSGEILVVVEVEVKKECVALLVFLDDVAVALLYVHNIAVLAFHLNAAVPCGGAEGLLAVAHFAVAVVVAEVEVGAELAEEGHLEVNLEIADALIYLRLADVAVYYRNGVLGVDVADVLSGAVRAGKAAVDKIGGIVAEHVVHVHGQGRVEAHSTAKRTTVVVVGDIRALDIGAYVEKVVEEARSKVDRRTKALVVAALDNTVGSGVVNAHTVGKHAGSTAYRQAVVVAECRAKHFFLPVGVGSAEFLILS